MTDTTETTFQRARSAEHKSQRREAILAAATELALRDGVRTVSLGAIAAGVGIHKSALLRYFETREQIFLELTGRAWTEWATRTAEQLDQVRREATPASRAIPGILAMSFVSRPLLCDLIAHTALNLERHVSVAGVRAYKLVSRGAVTRVGHAIADADETLTAADGRELISDLALLAGAKWQIANPPGPLAELYRSDSALAHACVDLPADLTRAAAVIRAGLGACGR